MRDRLWAIVIVMAWVLIPSRADALVHVVQPGETLAGLAEKYYGRVQHERVLVAANHLDLQGGIRLMGGMRLEIPTTSLYVVKKGDTWAALAQRFLGSAERSDVLSMSNDSSPWMTPEPGARIVIPYNLSLVVSFDETVVSVAQKYLGDRNKAWMLTRYNGLKKGNLEKGAVLIIPLTDIELSEEGKRLATDYKSMEPDTTVLEQRREQKRIAGEIPALIADVRTGRYVDAVARANRFIATKALTQPQQATVYRQLLEAYVALDAQGLAAAACGDWKIADPTVTMDPVMLSPKLIAACKQSVR
jgi:LysM repeat protein